MFVKVVLILAIVAVALSFKVNNVKFGTCFISDGRLMIFRNQVAIVIISYMFDVMLLFYL